MKKLILNIDVFAGALENRLMLSLLPTPKGIYRVGCETPVVRTNESIYRKTGLDTNGIPIFAAITNASEISGDIYNNRFEVIIPAYVSKNKGKFLTNTPTVPVYGRKILLARVRDYISKISLFENCSNNVNLQNAYREYIESQQISYFDFEDIVVETLVELISNVRDFTGTNTWNIVIATLNGRDLILDDAGDFRVREWEKINNESSGNEESFVYGEDWRK